jgi:hypothetical protein
LSYETGIDSVLAREKTSSDDRLVSSDVGSSVESFLVESRFSIGNDSSYVSLDTSGHSFSIRDNSSSSVDGRSNGSGRSGSESVLISRNGGRRFNDRALGLDVDVNDLGEELRETEAELIVRR